MKWLKNLLKKFKKNQKPNGYPTQADVNKMVEDYKKFLDNVKRDSKGRWIMPDGEAVSTARFNVVIEKRWEDSKSDLIKSCKCKGGNKCQCKKI